MEQEPTHETHATGPRTEAGKAVSRFNAVKHNLYSKVHIHSLEETEAFNAHCAIYRTELRPVGGQEAKLVHLIALCYWRLERAAAVEDNLFARAIHRNSEYYEEIAPGCGDAFAEAEAFTDNARFLTQLTQLESRLRRAAKEHRLELDALQSARKAAYDKAREEAIRLAGAAAKRGEVYDPAPDFPDPAAIGGFVFQLQELIQYHNRQARLRNSDFHPGALVPAPNRLPEAA